MDAAIVELWRKIDSWPYDISSVGRIRRCAKGSGTHVGYVLKPRKYKNGYLYVCLRDRKKVKYVQLHRLVAIAFLPICKEKQHVNHIDGNKENNCVENLEFVSISENIQHSLRMGLHKSGEHHRLAKITEKEVQEIRANRGIITQRKLADQFGVSVSSIKHIQNKRNWKWINEQ